VNRQPIIVGGFYRSGTSLVRRLLDAHSGIHCSPEVKFFPDFFGLYKNDPLAHVRFFATARCLGLPERDLLEIFGSAYRQVREQAALAHGKARWADKIPENVLYLDRWSEILGDGFSFIHVVRNPLDALGSLKEACFQKTVPDSFTERVEMYRAFRTAGDDHVARYPENSFVLEYEALVADPAMTLASLFSFLGESFEREVMVRYRDDSRGLGLEDAKVRTTTAIHSNSVGRSRAVLSLDEAALVTTELAAWIDTPS
jgi:hypothetical protein